MAEITDLVVVDDNNTARFPENMSFAAVNNAARALEGILARWFKDTNGSLAASGSSNAFTVTSNRTISSLADGIVLAFQANHTITGAATLNLNSLGAKDIKRFNGSALSSGDIISGQPVQVMYSLALDDWIMVSALAALVGSTHADFSENASPGTPAANVARLYAKDDSGNTILAYRDSAGVEAELLAGTVVQRAYAESTANTSLSDTPADDTIPQNTEGTEIVTATLTPRKTTNRIRARFSAFAGGTSGTAWIIALHQDSVADALHAVHVGLSDANRPTVGYLEFEHSPGTVSAVTYKIRCGKVAVTMAINGNPSSRLFGGVARATLVLEEIHV